MAPAYAGVPRRRGACGLTRWPRCGLSARAGPEGAQQYRYHPRWRWICRSGSGLIHTSLQAGEVRDESKYNKMLIFARVLPLIRARVDADLRGRQSEALIWPWHIHCCRREAKSIPRGARRLPTLARDRHAQISGRHIRLSFRGRGFDRGQRLSPRDHRRRHNRQNFRIWAATNLAALALREFARVDSEAKRKRAVVRTVERVAKDLGDTPAICRRCYTHPAIFEGFVDGTLLAMLAEKTRIYLAQKLEGMSAEEAAVVAFLRLRPGELAEEAA
jgi:DNA topoisomerase I